MGTKLEIQVRLLIYSLYLFKHVVISRVIEWKNEKPTDAKPLIYVTEEVSILSKCVVVNKKTVVV